MTLTGLHIYCFDDVKIVEGWENAAHYNDLVRFLLRDKLLAPSLRVGELGSKILLSSFFSAIQFLRLVSIASMSKLCSWLQIKGYGWLVAPNVKYGVSFQLPFSCLTRKYP